MLPDYPEVKKFAQSLLLRAVKNQIHREEPVLAGVRHTMIHEGGAASLTRSDSSSEDVELKSATAEIAIPREQMRRVTAEQLQQYIVGMAHDLAEHQVRTMFEEISRAAGHVGNAVSAKELGEKEAFLEMERKIEMEFDPSTLEPKGLMFVMHPTQAERWRKLAAEWEKDPQFQSERKRIREMKIEEWRARENRRQLVD